jgi:hypothetical protein
LRVELVRPLIVYRSWILLAMFVVGSLVAAMRFFSPAEYTVTVILLPTATNDQDRTSSALGVAALAGINLRGVGAGRAVSPFDRFMYLVNSPELAEWQIKHHDVRPLIFPQRWDADHKTWKAPEGLLAGLFGAASPEAPDAYEVAREYDAHLGIKKMMSGSAMAEGTGMVGLTYTDKSADRAYTILNNIMDDANELLRQDAAVRAAIQADYLRNKLASVAVEDYRQTLQKMLSEQEQTLMLTNSHLPFAAQSVSGETLPPERASKRTVLYSLIGAGFGFCVAYLFALLHYNLRRGRVDSRSVKSAGRVPVFTTLARSLGFAKAH